MTTKPPSPSKPSSEFLREYLPELEAPSFPKFPTFAELVEAEQKSPPTTAPKKLNDLFDGILGDLTPLLSDYARCPEKYGEETHPLLEQLTSGSKSLEQLSENERRILNLATFDFYQVDPPKKEAARPPLVKESSAKDGLELEEELRDEEPETQGPGPRPGIDVPETELPAYWWLR